MKQFTWHCGASVLVDDAYAEWDVTAPTVDEAFDNAYKHVTESNVLDSGTLDFHMDEVQIAMNLANLACEDNESFEPSECYVDGLKTLYRNNPDIYCDLERIISNANQKGELD